MTNCTRTCWTTGAVLGLLVLIFTSGIGPLRWFEGLFLGLIVAGLSGQLLIWLACSGAEAASGSEWQPASTQRSNALQPGPREVAADFAGINATAEEPQSVGPSGDAQVKTGDTLSGSAARNDIYGGKSRDTGAGRAQAEAAQVKGDETVASAAVQDAGAKQESSVKTVPEAEVAPKAKGEAEAKASPDRKPAPKTKAPTRGEADDLKKIKGIGPKCEEILVQQGITTFAQIAVWNEAEIDSFAEAMGNIGSRIRSEEWIEQAKILAKGDDTEFSERVEKGEVY